jgi:hypothetical protein
MSRTLPVCHLHAFMAGTIETFTFSFTSSFSKYLQHLYFHSDVIISILSQLAHGIKTDTRWGSDVIGYFISRQTAHCVHCSVQVTVWDQSWSFCLKLCRHPFVHCNRIY